VSSAIKAFAALKPGLTEVNFTKLRVIRPALIRSTSETETSAIQKYTVIPAPILAIFASPHKAPSLPPNAPPARAARMAAMLARENANTEAQVKAFESGLPHARVVRLPGAEHYVFRSNEVEVIREMNSFLAALP
jgi:pimeloyl-ACP methyl ester carboxylesterase